MGIEARKQNRETSQALIRRFTKKVQQSGVLLRAKRARFRKRLKSRQMKKKAALRREETRKEYERLKKLGKVR